MKIPLTPDLEQAIARKAQQENTTPEAIVMEAICEKLGLDPAALQKILDPRDEWEKRLQRLGTRCGVSMSDEDLSSEGLYD